MKNFTCPKCEQDTISVKAKYLTGHWFNVYCPACGARLCAEPIITAVVYMLYFWTVAWFVVWAMAEDDWTLALYMIPVWLIIDITSLLYLPLRTLRPKKAVAGKD